MERDGTPTGPSPPGRSTGDVEPVEAARTQLILRLLAPGSGQGTRLQRYAPRSKDQNADGWRMGTPAYRPSTSRSRSPVSRQAADAATASASTASSSGSRQIGCGSGSGSTTRRRERRSSAAASASPAVAPNLVVSLASSSPRMNGETAG